MVVATLTNLMSDSHEWAPSHNTTLALTSQRVVLQ